MRVHLFPDHEAVSQAVADRLVHFLADRPRSVLALPSGRTPERLYALLAENAEAFEEARIFGLDEFYGLPENDARSFRTFFENHVFGPLAIPPRHGHVLNGQARDAQEECARYEAAIAQAGGLDLTLLGLGANGHIAFNEPAPVLAADTHLENLTSSAAAIAPQALTMGVGTLLSAPRVYLMASGADKAEAVARMLSGVVDPLCPATLLQVHPGAEVFLDQSAASRASLG